jgi:hypothetical protein
MHVMIDLETMGTSPNAPIVAIGACRFDKDGVAENKFYATISLSSAVASGAEMDADTVLWWMQQDNNAKAEVFNATGDAELSLLAFTNWLRLRDISGVWGNGASFDNVILAQTYRRFDQPQPWPFWLDRCYRTVKNFSDVEMVREGTHHNALDDAVSQANHLIAIWKKDKPDAVQEKL